MATSNTVTLTFAANTRPLQQGFKDVSEGALVTERNLARAGESTQSLSDKLEETGRTAKGTKELMRGAGDAAFLFGGEMGGAAIQAGFLVGAIKDLSKGGAKLVPEVKAWAGSLTLLRAAGITAGAALLTFAAQQEASSQGSANWAHKMAADANYALASDVHFVTQGVPLLGKLAGAWQSSADGTSKAAHQMVNAADAARNALLALANAQRAAGTYGIADANPGGDAFVDQSALDMMELDPTVLRKQYLDSLPKASGGGGGGGSSTLSAAMKADQSKAQATLSAWQSTLDRFRDISKGIQESLAPKLEAGDKGLLLFPGMSLLAKLKQQLTDTLHLQKDLAQLKSAGLNGDLLGSLAAGGLGSLGAADELLAGGKSGISGVNKTAAGITKAGGTIASNEAMRQFNAQKDVKVKIDVTGGDKELLKLIRKWVRTDFGGNVQLALGGK